MQIKFIKKGDNCFLNLFANKERKGIKNKHQWTQMNKIIWKIGSKALSFSDKTVKSQNLSRIMSVGDNLDLKLNKKMYKMNELNKNEKFWLLRHNRNKRSTSFKQAKLSKKRNTSLINELSEMT